MPYRLRRSLVALLLAAILFPAFAHADEAQIWVFVKIVDKQVEGQKVEVQIPIEVLKQIGTLRFWDLKHEKVLGQIDGALLFNNYKNTKINENDKLMTMKDEDAELVIVISGKERRPGAAHSLKAELLDRTSNQSNEWAWPLSSLGSSIRNFFTSDIWGSQALKARIEGIDRLEQCIEPLGNVPPYSVIKVDGGPTRLIVKTE